MASREDFATYRLRRSEYEARTVEPHETKALKFIELCASFGRLAIGSLIALNGGALVTIPALVSAVASDNVEFNEQLICLGQYFVFGIFAALVAALSAYVNYMLHANQSTDEGLWNFWAAEVELPHPYADEAYKKQTKSTADEKHTEIERRQQKRYWVINGTAICGVLFSIASAVLFFLACLGIASNIAQQLA